MKMKFNHKSTNTIRSNKQPAGLGKPCASCGEPMQRWVHTPGWRPPAGKGWHTHWFACVRPGCNRYQKVVYEEGSFRHDNPYKLAAFNDAAMKRRVLKRIDQLQAQVDRNEVSDEDFSVRVAEIESSIAERLASPLDTST
jgi:hypothetical protein